MLSATSCQEWARLRLRTSHKHSRCVRGTRVFGGDAHACCMELEFFQKNRSCLLHYYSARHLCRRAQCAGPCHGTRVDAVSAVPRHMHAQRWERLQTPRLRSNYFSQPRLIAHPAHAVFGFASPPCMDLERLKPSSRPVVLSSKQVYCCINRIVSCASCFGDRGLYYRAACRGSFKMVRSTEPQDFLVNAAQLPATVDVELGAGGVFCQHTNDGSGASTTHAVEVVVWVACISLNSTVCRQPMHLVDPFRWPAGACGPNTPCTCCS